MATSLQEQERQLTAVVTRVFNAMDNIDPMTIARLRDEVRNCNGQRTPEIMQKMQAFIDQHNLLPLFNVQ